jgi:hypothetical protein
MGEGTIAPATTVRRGDQHGATERPDDIGLLEVGAAAQQVGDERVQPHRDVQCAGWADAGGAPGHAVHHLEREGRQLAEGYRAE